MRFGHGHAPDHATLWSEDGEIVLGGDQLLPSISPNLGVYATEPGADPVAEWIAACRKLQPFATEAQLVLPGHKLPFTGLPDRLRQMIDNHEGRPEPVCAITCARVRAPRRIASRRSTSARSTQAPTDWRWSRPWRISTNLLALGEVIRERRADGAWIWSLAADRQHP